MSSYLDFEGVYDKNKRYMIYNWSPEDFVQHFGQEATYNENNVIVNHPAYNITIKAGEMRELGQFEAFTITKHFVNREMLRDSFKKEGKERERLEMAINNKDSRKPYEDKTIKEIISGEEIPFMDILKDKVRAEIEKEKVKPEETNIKVTKPRGRPKSNNSEFAE